MLFNYKVRIEHGSECGREYYFKHLLIVTDQQFERYEMTESKMGQRDFTLKDDVTEDSRF